MHDDIPEAIRSSVHESKASKLPFLMLAAGGGTLLIGAVTLGLLLLRSPQPSPSAGEPPTRPGLRATNTTATPSATAGDDRDETVLGHFAYPEAPANERVAVSADGQIKLRQAAAEAYQRMVADAAADGITLVPISGFRSVSDQNDLFFRVKEERNQAVSQRAEVSAPPGHSEHHTGYAIDLGDGAFPDTNLSQRFAETPAFIWLSNNAARYSFELSFPQGNPQGVSYEPWHWRFVGDRNSLETFYRAKKAASSSP